MSFNTQALNPFEYTHDQKNNKGAYRKAAIWGADSENPKETSRKLYYLDKDGNEQELNSVDVSGPENVYYVEINNGEYVATENDTSFPITPYYKLDNPENPVSYALYDLDVKNKIVGTNPIPGTYKSAVQFKALTQINHNDTLNRNVIGAHDDIYTRTYDTYAAMRAETESLSSSKFVKTRQHTSNNVGGTNYIKTGQTGTPNTGNEIEWYDSSGNQFVIDSDSVDMYQLGGAFEGNCEDAFNLAISDDRIIYVHCPDKTSYGDHDIDCKEKKIRGHGTHSYHTTPAGFHPRNVSDRLVIEGFDMQMTEFPRTGGDNANSQVFITLATPNADIQDLVVKNNKTRNGRIGISTAVEGARILRGQIIIELNDVFDPMGSSVGQGYGVHVSNESPYGGEIIARHNHVWRADRHSYYLAKNTQDGTSIKFYCNTAHDHRENSETKGGGARAAIELSRCRNVTGWGNSVFGFYDSALTMTEEKVVIDGASELNIRLTNTTITNPKNAISAINVGYLTRDNTARVDGVTLDGINYTCNGDLTGGLMVEAVRVHYGERVFIKGLDSTYRNITSGTIRPIVLQGTDATGVRQLKVHDTILKCENCTGANVGVFRFLDACRDDNVDIELSGLQINSDASPISTIDSTGAISNNNVLIRGFEISGAPISPRRIITYTTEDNRKIGGNTNPIGVVTPLYEFEEILMTLNNSFWKSYGDTDQDWKQISS